MTTKMFTCFCGLVLTLAGCRTWATTTRPLRSDLSPAVGVSGDSATDLVVDFYRVLLQEQPPTQAEESRLFGTSSSLRWRLALKDKRGGLEDVEPMERTPEQLAQRKQLERDVQAAGPVVLNYFRQHREWFLPKSMRSLSEIQISTGYHFVCNLDHLKDPARPGDCQVLVTFTDDKQVPPEATKTRILMFRVRGDKIDPDAIWVGADRGSFVEDLVRGTR